MLISNFDEKNLKINTNTALNCYLLVYKLRNSVKLRTFLVHKQNLNFRKAKKHVQQQQQRQHFEKQKEGQTRSVKAKLSGRRGG
jgi:hypothetical protein